MKIVVLMPCLDDLETATELVSEIRELGRSSGNTTDFLIVDDGSNPPLKKAVLDEDRNRDSRIEVLELARNLGHQRAIACGLCHLFESGVDADGIVVMDSDGEDRPEDVWRLAEALSGRSESMEVVFAERGRRTEGLVFRLGYRGYLLLHRVLVGTAPRVGNFSALHPGTLRGLVGDPDLWSHYAATIWKSRLPRTTLPTGRGERRRGESRLNLGALVLHGLGAITCYRETLALRILAACIGVLIIGVAALAVLVLGSEGNMSGALFWSSVLLLLLPLHACCLALWQCFNVLQGRHQASFIPIRDYRYFVNDGRGGKPSPPADV